MVGRRIALYTGVVLVIVLLVVPPPANAHGGDHTTPIQTFTQAVGPYDLAVMIELPEAVPAPLFLNIVPQEDIGTATITFRTVPRGHSFDNAPVAQVTSAGPPDIYYTRLEVDRAGAWDLEVAVDGTQGRAVARIPFTITVCPIAALFDTTVRVAGVLVVLMVTSIALGAIANGRKQPMPRWINQTMGQGIFACVIVAAIFGVQQFLTTVQQAEAANRPPVAYGRPYAIMDVRTQPMLPEVGQPITVTLDLSDSGSGLPVDDLMTHHEALMHTVVVSEDGSDFRHVHPSWIAGGQYAVALTPEQAGRYTVYAEIARQESGTQMLARDLVVRGAAPAAAAAPAPGLGVREIAGMQIDVTASTPSVQVGQQTTLTFNFSSNGMPINDLQPWLGMAGHLMVRNDAGALAHIHAAEQVPPSEPALARATRYGPQVRFVYNFPQPGHYQVWAQFQRNHEIVTVPLTLEVQE